MMVHIDLESYYRIMFALMQHHKYSKADLEDMEPYEREIFYMMLIDHLKELEESQKK